MDPTGEESFSLSSNFDFNSSFELYSSDEDDDDYVNEQQLDKRNKNDIDAYIELELPPAALAAALPTVPTQVEATDDDNELEFRISFSAVVPFPGFRPSSINSANIVSSKETCSTAEDANAQLTAANDSGPQPVVGSKLSCILRRPKNNYYTVSISPPAWKRFQPPVDDDYADDCRIKDINSWELVRSRKASSKINRAAANGEILKLLVKLRSIIISGLGSMRAPLLHPSSTANSRQQRWAYSRRISLMKPLDKWFTWRKLDEQQQLTTRTNGRSSSEMISSSKVLEMDFDAVRKLFGSGVSQL
ncbi:hypothetical protein Pfo_029105 [Paulownia fortunei]|nr:hypothetical protein Pfo_029105 [Paulownia fortunei]